MWADWGKLERYTENVEGFTITALCHCFLSRFDHDALGRRQKPYPGPMWFPVPAAPRDLSLTCVRPTWLGARHFLPKSGWRLRGTACPHASTTLHAGLVVFSDEAADRVVRVELLALQLGARRGRGVVGLEPLLDGAALVGKTVYLVAFVMGWADRRK